MSTRTTKASTATSKPASSKTAGAASKSAAKPVKATAAKPASKPAAKPAAKPASKPAAKPAAKPASATVKPAAKPAVKAPQVTKPATTTPAKATPKAAAKAPAPNQKATVSMAEVESAAAAAEQAVAESAVAVVNETAAAIASILPTPLRRGPAAERRDRHRPTVGTVALAAAGPGDPDLVSVRTATLLGDADLIIADVSAVAVAERYAGAGTTISLALDPEGLPLEASARVKRAVEAARSSQDVVRLFSSDPVTDAAWAVEASLLAKAKVPFEVSPGVSLVGGVTSHAGIPLVEGRNREVRIVDANDPAVDWSHHIDPRVTVVVLNGADRATDVARDLIAAGRREDTPVAVTRDGTTVDQRTVSSTLRDLPAAVKASRYAGPGLLVIGEPVSRRGTLSWFETKPLFGWRVLLPRTKESQPALIDHLRRYGAVAVEVPTISVEPPRTPQQMERSVHGLVAGRYQWVVFTSVNAVRALREKFDEYGLDSRAYSGLRIAAVGHDTAAALEAFGVRPDLMPSGEQSTGALVDEFPEFDEIVDPINRVFLPRADIATESLVAGLTELGWEVDDVTAYRTVRAAPPPAETREAIKSGGFDAVLFTSSSTVRNLVGIAGKPHQLTIVACIGPQTAKAAEEHGLRVDVLSETSNVFALVEALAEHGEKLRLAAADSGEQTWRPSRRRAGARRRPS